MNIIKKNNIICNLLDTEKIIKKTNIINKGTGAGGASTNFYGKKFEDKTNNETRLLNIGFSKNFYNNKSKKIFF